MVSVRFLSTAGLACIITSLRKDVKDVKNAQFIMMSVGILLVTLAVLQYGFTSKPTSAASSVPKQAAKQE